MTSIPKSEQAKFIKSERIIEWFNKWISMLDINVRKPSEYIDITPQELLVQLKADGHDMSTATYAEADPYELIVQEHGLWLAFNQERGQRFDVKVFSTKGEAELFTAEKLIKTARLVVKMGFDDKMS